MSFSIFAIAIYSFLLCFGTLTSAQTNEVNALSVEVEPVSREHFISMLHLIACLADERFGEDQARGETWIFGVHPGSYIRKYSDGKRTIVLLPGGTHHDMSAMATYASSYNARQLQECNRLAQEDKYLEGLELIRLIAHFGPKDAIQTHGATLGVSLLEKLVRGEEVQKTKEELKDLITPPIARHDLRGIRRGKSEVVDDLLQIKVKN